RCGGGRGATRGQGAARGQRAGRGRDAARRTLRRRLDHGRELLAHALERDALDVIVVDPGRVDVRVDVLVIARLVQGARAGDGLGVDADPGPILGIRSIDVVAEVL